MHSTTAATTIRVNFNNTKNIYKINDIYRKVGNTYTLLIINKVI